MIEGPGAPTTECMSAARRYGVGREVLASLADTLPHEDWSRLARDVIGRALLHGERRAEGAREVARTVREAGVEPTLGAPTALRQDWAAERGRELPPHILAGGDLETLPDAMLALPAPRATASGED